ncbi:MAG: 30S ribosomal protein S16 [Candidatus Latescibacterota bacterium]
MVKLRLKRMGRKHRPFYRIVAMTDNQSRSGQALEELGTYDPVHARFDVDEAAAITWLDNGAQMTNTVHDLFNSKGLLARWRGFEGSEDETALKRDKPKRRKKLALTSSAKADETPEAVAEEAVAAEAEVATPAPAGAAAPAEETAGSEEK